MKVRFDAFELDSARFELRRDGQLVPLQRRAFDLLRYLVEHRDVVVGKDELLENVWSGVTVTKDSLAQAIMAVRNALGDDVDEPKYVQTVRGRGYRFVADVTEGSARQVVASPVSTPASAPAASRLVGRDREIAVLTDRLARAASGKGGVVLIGGETGSGKTALVDELCASATTVRCVAVRCFGGGGAPDLFPFRELARELGVAFDVPDATALADEATRFRVLSDVVSALLGAAKDQPLFVVIDDLHLADASSLAALELLASRVRSAPILIAGVHGPSTPRHAGFASTLTTITREATTTVLRLEPLSLEDIARFVEQTTGKRPSAELVAKLHEKTKGNPLFLTQLAPVLRAEERLRANEMATSLLASGEGMSDAITQHLAALAPATARVLTVAAVFGRAFRLAPLAAALGISNDEVLRELDAADALRIVKRADAGGLYRFSVPLVRDVLYRKLPAAERAKLHATAARALEDHLGGRDDHERVGEVASHLVEAAALGDVERAADLSLRAAQLAVAAGDRAAAQKYANRGLDAFRFAQKVDEDRRRALAALASVKESASASSRRASS